MGARKRLAGGIVAAGAAVGLVLMGGPVAPASAQQASAVSAAKKLTIDGPSTGRVGSPVKVRMYVPSESGTIDWGDGTTTPVKSGISLSLCMGSASACADARRTLTARHAYAAPGRYTITVVSPDSTPKRASLTIRIR